MTVFFKSEKRQVKRSKGERGKLLSPKSQAISETSQSIHISEAIHLQLHEAEC